jgi:MYXO-CTERM domain-containing protein
MKMFLSLIGAFMTALGALWIGQGLNLVQWPASSFMIGAPKWSLIGTGVALAGLALIWLSQRRR